MTSTQASNEWDSRGLYDVYRIKIRARETLCGGVPKNEELIAPWIKARTGFDDDLTKVQTQEALDALTEEVTEKSWNGFRGDEKGLYLPTFQIKAMFKECASLLRITQDKRGSKQIVQHGSFLVRAMDGGTRIYLGKQKADGFDEGPIHVQTAQGPRTALKRVDYVEDVTIEFELWVMGTHPSETRHVGEKEVRQMLLFAQENGLGADRSQGKGCFDVLEFEVVQKAELTRKAEPEAKPAKAKKTKEATNHGAEKTTTTAG